MKKYIHKLNQSGVTLIEMLITMGLLAIMLVVIATIFTSAADTQERTNSFDSKITNGRLLIARLNYDISNATSIISPSTLGQKTSTLVLNEGGTTYTYSLWNNNLQLTDGTGTDALNDNNVDVADASFQLLGNPGGKPTIYYSVKLNSTTAINGVWAYQTFTSTAGLR
jgi:prepilin-type N-terminal cleavage/methylation domain-containing protein